MERDDQQTVGYPDAVREVVWASFTPTGAAMSTDYYTRLEQQRGQQPIEQMLASLVSWRIVSS